MTREADPAKKKKQAEASKSKQKQRKTQKNADKHIKSRITRKSRKIEKKQGKERNS